MSRTRRTSNNQKGKRRHISVRAVRRDTLDLRRLGRAIVTLALAEAEADAQAQTDTTEPNQPRPGRPGSDRAASTEPADD